MSVLAIRLARFLPLLGILIHLAGLFVYLTLGQREVGLMMTRTAWVFTGVYLAVLWFTGDFIQRSLDFLPLLKKDEWQIREARRVASHTYLVLCCALGVVIGLHGRTFFADKVNSAGVLAAAGESMVLQLMFVAYLAVILPTCFLAWSMRPLHDGEA